MEGNDPIPLLLYVEAAYTVFPLYPGAIASVGPELPDLSAIVVPVPEYEFVSAASYQPAKSISYMHARSHTVVAVAVFTPSDAFSRKEKVPAFELVDDPIKLATPLEDIVGAECSCGGSDASLYTVEPLNPSQEY